MTPHEDITRLANFLSPGARAADAAPGSETEWAPLVNAAIEHRCAGLLLERAAQLSLRVPTMCRTELDVQARCIASANLALERELETVLDALNDEGIPVMLLKGAALNRSVYDGPELRPMSDLDLLVRPEHAQKALETLLRQSCRKGVDLVRADFFPRFYYEAELWTRSAHPARVDLHARPFRPLRYGRVMPDSPMWDQARLTSVGDAKAYIPSDARMFVHLAAHAAFHGFARLIWCYDLARWTHCRHDAIDWHDAVECCRVWGLSLAVGRALQRTAALFGRSWPEEIERQLAAVRTGWRDRLVLRQAPHDAASPIRHVAVNCLTTPGARYVFDYLRSVITPDDGQLATTYPHRHPGWRVAATIQRLARAALRPMGITT